MALTLVYSPFGASLLGLAGSGRGACISLQGVRWFSETPTTRSIFPPNSSKFFGVPPPPSSFSRLFSGRISTGSAAVPGSPARGVANRSSICITVKKISQLPGSGRLDRTRRYARRFGHGSHRIAGVDGIERFSELYRSQLVYRHKAPQDAPKMPQRCPKDASKSPKASRAMSHAQILSKVYTFSHLTPLKIQIFQATSLNPPTGSALPRPCARMQPNVPQKHPRQTCLKIRHFPCIPSGFRPLGKSLLKHLQKGPFCRFFSHAKMYMMYVI